MRKLITVLMLTLGRLRLIGRVQLSIAKSASVRLDRIGPMPDCKVFVGPNSIINSRISFDREGAKFICGARCYIGASHLVAAEEIELGDDVVISWGVTIVDHNSHAIDWELRKNDILNWRRGQKKWDAVIVSPVKLEDKVWIGFNATILKGVTIGEGAVVGAGSVVTQDVAPYTVVGGNPARVIRELKGADT